MNKPSEQQLRGQPLIASLEDWHFWCAGRDVLIDRLLTRHLHNLSGRFILDVGAGTGHYAARLQLQGARVMAADNEISPLARERELPFVQGSVVQLPLEDHRVEAVLARDVLEHVDENEALQEWQRVLQPDGLLIVLVPAFPSLWGPRDVQAGHLRRYRRADLAKVIRANGFTLLELRGYQMTLLPLMFLSRRRARRLGHGELATEEQPGRLTNRLFVTVNTGEARLARFAIPLPPIGSTLVAVARRS